MGYPDPTLYAIPFFLLTLVSEPALLRWQARRGRDVVGYEARDRNASLGLGLGSLLSVSAINLGVFTLAGWLFRHRLLSLGTGALAWSVALVGWDFAYYWRHRAEHRVRLLWACHVNHHSSQHYNLSTALRQPWTPFSELVVFPPLALLGVPPWMIMVSGGLNLIYQYWIHTEVIDRMPAWFEAVFNTPSHHRVHHGSNPEYIDRNYGGVLIVWDRLFGTFEPERRRVVYGLTKNVHTYNLFSIAFHEYRAVARDVARARGWRDRLGVLFRGPEWTAPSLRG
jgi:sterol desaturase/sphingolipid hydroxylase (fatty acid hydroxylase superfamily)